MQAAGYIGLGSQGERIERELACRIHLARLTIICDMLTTFPDGAMGDEAFLAPRSYA